jgi:hypothetical protein
LTFDFNEMEKIEKMYLYLVERTDAGDYDTYDSFVVCCESKKVALDCHPSTEWHYVNTPVSTNSSWTTPENIKVTKIGLAHKRMEKGIVIASFNAG